LIGWVAAKPGPQGDQGTGSPHQQPQVCHQGQGKALHKINDKYLEIGKQMSPLIVLILLYFLLFSELNILITICYTA
jgi:hypothetical protein